MIRRVDDLGRIVIPRDVRKLCDIREGTPMQITTVGDDIVLLRKYDYEVELSKALSVVEKALLYTVCTSDMEYKEREGLMASLKRRLNNEPDSIVTKMPGNQESD